MKSKTNIFCSECGSLMNVDKKVYIAATCAKCGGVTVNFSAWKAGRAENEQLHNRILELQSVKQTCDDQKRWLDEWEAENERLLSQLPEGMKQCTILFIECERGHGRLTATNWIDHGCPQCRIEQQREALVAAAGFIGTIDTLAGRKSGTARIIEKALGVGEE